MGPISSAGFDTSGGGGGGMGFLDSILAGPQLKKVNMFLNMVFLTVKYNGKDRNSYFEGTDRRAGSTRRNCGCWLFVANSNQSRSQHSFEYLTFILFVNLSYLPAIVSSAADFSWRGYTFPFSPQSGFGFSYPAVFYLVSF